MRSARLELTTDRSTIGKAAENDIPLDDDATASHLHAVLELKDRGCPAELALRILAPLDESRPPC